MLGPSMILGGPPLALGCAISAIRRPPVSPIAIVAISIAGLELLGVGAIVLIISLL